jgi:hypothetical protein
MLRACPIFDVDRRARQGFEFRFRERPRRCRFAVDRQKGGSVAGPGGLRKNAQSKHKERQQHFHAILRLIECPIGVPGTAFPGICGGRMVPDRRG